MEDITIQQLFDLQIFMFVVFGLSIVALTYLVGKIKSAVDKLEGKKKEGSNNG